MMRTRLNYEQYALWRIWLTPRVREKGNYIDPVKSYPEPVQVPLG